MRFMTMIRINENDVPDGGPSPELMEEMGKLLEEMTKAGVLLDTAGLRPTAEGTRVHWSHGKESVVDGPFTEAKELVGGWALLECRDLAEAIEWSKRFVGVLGEGEVRVRPVFTAE